MKSLRCWLAVVLMAGRAFASDCTIVHFTLRPTSESEIHCRLLLPPPEKWDGRFWGIGNQDRGSDLREWLFRGWQLPHARAGSATCLADMGTSGGRFGREVVRDFGWRACHLMTVEAKKRVEAFYGRAAKKSYFCGISSGGGQGFHEALRFPVYFKVLENKGKPD